MHVVIVKAQLKPEFLSAFLSVTVDVDARGAVEQEPGCVRFDVIQSAEEPTTVYLYEVYRDDEAFQAHLRTAHFQTWRDTVQDTWCAKPTEVSHGVNLYPTDKRW